MECAENYCGTVGNMRHAESCPDSSRMRFQLFTGGAQVRVVVGV